MMARTTRAVRFAGHDTNDAPARLRMLGLLWACCDRKRRPHLGPRCALLAIVLSRAIMRNMRQNLIFGFGYNALGIPVGAGVLFPAFGLLLNPMIAAAAMSLS